MKIKGHGKLEVVGFERVTFIPALTTPQLPQIPSTGSSASSTELS